MYEDDDDGVGRELFARETEILNVVAHKPDAARLFVKVYGVVSSKLYIVMDRMGDSVCDLTRFAKKKLNRRIRLRILQDVATAMDSLWAALPADVASTLGTQGRIMHRDLKSDNVLLVRDWQASVVAAPDTAIARVIDYDCGRSASGNPSSFSILQGNQAYVPPEQKHENYDALQGDIYRWGVFAYEVWTGSFFLDYDESDRAMILNNKPGSIHSVVTLSTEKLNSQYQLFKASVSPALTNLIQSCWLKQHARPESFASILSTLQKIAAEPAFSSFALTKDSVWE